MPGLDPGIHVFASSKEDVDGRVKPGHDGISNARAPAYLVGSGYTMLRQPLRSNGFHLPSPCASRSATA